MTHQEQIIKPKEDNESLRRFEAEIQKIEDFAMFGDNVPSVPTKQMPELTLEQLNEWIEEIFGNSKPPPATTYVGEGAYRIGDSSTYTGVLGAELYESKTNENDETEQDVERRDCGEDMVNDQ